MDKVFQLPGYITKISTMAKNTVRLQIDSQENVSGEGVKRMFDMMDQLGNFLFVIHREIEPEDLLDIPVPEPEFKNEKSDSQRMRNVLYRLWEQNSEGYKDFQLYYHYHMGKIIDHLKSKLD